MTHAHKDHITSDAKKSEKHDETIAEQVTRHFHEARAQYEKIHGQVESASDSLVKATRDKPLVAIGAAIALGFLFGKLFK